MRAGSVLLFAGRLYHGAGANVTSRPRLGVVIDYVQPWLRPCEAHTLSASHEQVRQLPQRLQELLGFNQPTPYLGFVHGRHPRDWLMNDPAQPPTLIRLPAPRRFAQPLRPSPPRSRLPAPHPPARPAAWPHAALMHPCSQRL